MNAPLAEKTPKRLQLAATSRGQIRTSLVPLSLSRPAAPHPAAGPAYTLAARLLHWVTAALMLVAVPLGVIIANDWGGEFQDALYDLHRSLGAMLIPVMAFRLIYRLAHQPAPLSADILPVQRLAAHATHLCLYTLLLIQPVLGWVATSAYPAKISVFGLFDLPPLYVEDRALSEQLFSIHAAIGAILALLVVVHVTAALYHHFIRKDRVLMRMISG